MNLLVKVCGMTDGENIRQVEETGVAMMGFIFYPPSPRYVRERPGYLPVKTKRVGVFVNEDSEQVLMRVKSFGLDYVQLHGNESPEYCFDLFEAGVKLIKAISISSSEELKQTTGYEGLCEFFLFDTPTPNYGGSGKAFNWELLREYRGKTPFLLSGGIQPDSAEAIKSFYHPCFVGLDLNSRFELRPGIKDVKRIQSFLEALK